MRCMARSRAVFCLMVLAAAFAAAALPARAQMCTAAVNDCETQAATEAQRCAFQCQRYDTICADRCDDTHDVIVRYCWIKRSLCKASEESQSFIKAVRENK